MAERSTIEWTDASQNFWRGCDKVSPGCAHCYMFSGQRRFGKDPSVVVRAAPSTFWAPLRSKKWREQRAAIEATGRRMRVFTCSWGDFFHEDADTWRDEAWDVIRQCPEFDWQILTKRPENVIDRLPADWLDSGPWPHVWLGVSVENRRYVHRADLLRAIPAAVRFISAEPLLGPLVARWVPEGELGEWVWPDGKLDMDVGAGLDLTGIDWLIAGGESGPRHRRMDMQWVRDLRDACQSQYAPCACGTWGTPGDAREGRCLVCHNYRPVGRTAFFFKQWGGARPKSNGRLLDGREWSEMPSSRKGAEAHG
jgi:protein gp37